jgi:CheY-like chemotaxis protein
MPQSSRSATAAKRKPSGDVRRRPALTQRQRVHTALAGLAHEVRTPLNGILVLAELLAASDLPARERDWALALKGAAEHLANLTTTVVDGARAGMGTLVLRHESFDLCGLAQGLAQSLTARAQFKGLAADVDLIDDLPRAVSGDPVLLRAAIENLLDNAVKFTERGSIRLAIATEPGGEGRLRLRITVEDQGTGMSAAEMRRLFRPFAQANARVARRFGGAGLGLAFARKVARGMGGNLTVTSAPGEGSRFSFEAVLQTAVRQEPTGAAERSAAPIRALRILCAEDSPYGRALFSTMASSLGHAIDFVNTGEAAVQAAGASAYDLVLMDLTLPGGIDGLEATRRIRGLKGCSGRTPIVGISGCGEAMTEKAARLAGMNGYLVKPVTPRMLAAAVAASVNGER